ncbi:MAG TPA: hypothetical protein VNM37_23050, partial [Candidatus Dormibacteraeota bacterium]|nr:hypothetical protein [Candidatus Dormibacteraeota bacterium]
MDQLRYNTDKPCATYWYANHLALERFETSFTPCACPVEDAIVQSASTFLANVWSDPWAPLVRVVTALVLAIEDAHEEHAVSDLLPNDLTPIAFLAHCEHAL